MFNENYISIQISLKFFPDGIIENKPTNGLVSNAGDVITWTDMNKLCDGTKRCQFTKRWMTLGWSAKVIAVLHISSRGKRDLL